MNLRPVASSELSRDAVDLFSYDGQPAFIDESHIKVHVPLSLKGRKVQRLAQLHHTTGFLSSRHKFYSDAMSLDFKELINSRCQMLRGSSSSQSMRFNTPLCTPEGSA